MLHYAQPLKVDNLEPDLIFCNKINTSFKMIKYYFLQIIIGVRQSLNISTVYLVILTLTNNSIETDLMNISGI